MRKITLDGKIYNIHDNVDQSTVTYDNVKCCNCEYDGLVNGGEDVCPECGEECLAWKEDEPQEIEL